MKSHHHAYEVVVATLHGAHHDAVAQHVLEVAARRDGLLDSVGGHLSVEVRGPREVEDGVLRGQVVLFVEHAEETGEIQLARAGVPTGVLSVPCRNIHSGASVAAFSDIEAQYRLADSYLRRQ